jgi:hydroxylamine reductase
MVSGSNLQDLKLLLEALKNQDIDVYTNGNLLIAHAFSHFKSYKNLKGHFGTGVFNTILDFATFPGAILLTRNEFQNIEYLYRGRLFTTDKIAPQGVVKIENKNFLPLINSAKQAKGFAKGQDRGVEIVGYDERELTALLEDIVKHDYEKIFIIGPSNFSIAQQEYFKKFFALMGKNSFVISFSYSADLKNILHINVGNNYAILYNILQKIFEKIPINSEKLSFFMTKCDVNSLSNIINLKNKGAQNIFLSDCPPLVINPSVFKAFVNLLKIHNITTPKADLELLK